MAAFGAWGRVGALGALARTSRAQNGLGVPIDAPHAAILVEIVAS